MLRKLTLYFLVVISFSCSQFSNKKSAIKFHDINSKFNALWQAERIEKEMLQDIQEKQKENFSYEVSIVRSLDSTLFTNYKSNIDSIIYKASLIIQRHANSEYLDDAYFLIGKARIYQGDYENAIETFKYVNAISDDPELQVNSLLKLYELYRKIKEDREAERVKEFLLEFKLKDYQKKELYLYLANEYQETRNSNELLPLLSEAIKISKDKEEKARLSFILAQDYYFNGNNNLAIKYLEMTGKYSSDPDIIFESELIIYQIKEDIPTLEKLLKEAKFEDKFGKIYGTIGQIYAARGDYKNAETNWSKGTQNNPNSGDLYFQIAETQAKKIGNYHKAIAYYDSASRFILNTSNNFQKAQLANKNWKEFGKILENYELIDSLLKLSYLSEEELNQVFLKETLQDSSQNKENLKKPKERIELAVFTRRPPSSQQQAFYFYNDQLRLQGSINFKQKYGDRPLEDFWNRKYKVQQSFTDNQNFVGIESLIGNSQKPKLENANKNQTSIINFDEWKKNIPKDDIERLELEIQKEKSQFLLGKYSYENLSIPKFTQDILEEIITKNINSSFAPEIYYILYKLDPQKNNSYLKKLENNFPTSHFLAIIKREENGILSETKEIQAQHYYEEAFQNYQDGNYEESFSQCLILEKDFANSKFDDKILYLKALNKYALKDTNQAKLILNNLLNLYPNTNLKLKANNLLNKIN